MKALYTFVVEWGEHNMQENRCHNIFLSFANDLYDGQTSVQ